MVEAGIQSVQALVDGLIARSDESWREFISISGPIVRAASLRACLTNDEMEDVVQSVVLKLLDKDCRALRALTVTKVSSFYGWIKVVVSRTVIDYLRSHDLRFEKEQTWRENRWSDDVLGDESRDNIESRVVLERAVAGLQPHEKVLFQLDYGDLTDQQIADILGLELAAVQQRISRLRKKLRRILTGGSGEGD